MNKATRFGIDFGLGVVVTLLLIGGFLLINRWSALQVAWKYPKQVQSLDFQEKIEVSKK